MTAHNGRPDWLTVDTLLAEWLPRLLVIGLPLHIDGSDSELARRARRFGRQLGTHSRLPWRMMDERLSSVAARAELVAAGSAARKRSVHSVAARLILEAYLRSPERAEP